MNLRKFLSILVSLILCAYSMSVAQSPKKVPVYPGAVLSTEKEEGQPPVCCSFVTKDSFDKVLAFYENVLKTKALDPKQIAAKYPDMKSPMDQVQQSMPPGVKLRVFVLGDFEVNGKKGFYPFEVLSTPSEVKFTLEEGSLTDKDNHFVSEFKRQANQLGPGEQSEGTMLDWTKLKECLPAINLPGFVKGESSGETQRSGPSLYSNAMIQYSKTIQVGGEETASKSIDVTVTISDWIQNPDAIPDMTKPSDSSEKAIKAKGKYDGRVGSSDSECHKAFLVGKRFVVEVACTGSNDMSRIDKLIDAMDLDKLAGLK